MMLDDFRILKADGDGREFVEFAERPTKTRQVELGSKSRSFQPMMFETRDERCPVALF